MNIELITSVIKIIISASLFFVWVVRYDNIIKEFKNDYKYPSWLRDLTGILKLSFAAMLINVDPAINSVGLQGIALLMFFAILTHIKVKNTPRKALPAITLFSLCIFLLCV
tara:strand:+ start:5236 stop:5568 length:333 start_codon:yes stop_codon:yes gene_type:complete